jgi:hypothetical protein
VRCRLEHPSQPPLTADRLTTSLLGLDRAVITADCEAGAVRLVGAHLGHLDCSDATIRNDAGPALDGESLHVDQDVLLRRFEAAGAGEAGTVRLLGARISRLEGDGAKLRNDSGPALRAEGLQVKQDVLLRAGFECHGRGAPEQR